jgi:hypothetical protein
MFYDVRLFMTALYANEYLFLQIKFAVDWLSPFESELATAQLATRRGRRLDEGAHVMSFRPTYFGEREWGAQKVPD